MSGTTEARIQHLWRQTELHPSDPDPCRQVAEELERIGRITEATTARRMAVARRPGDPNEHIRLAEALVRAGREEDDAVRLPVVEEAAICLRTAIELDPDHARAYRELARLDLARARVLRDFDQVQAAAQRAVARCRQALELAPMDAEAYRVLGDLHLHVGEDHTKAGECYRTAIELDPEHWDARALLAAALARGGDRDAALEALRPVLDHDPEHALAADILKQIK